MSRRCNAAANELRRVYREHVAAVYAFFAYSFPRAEAEDLTSSTFERVVKSWPSYDPARATERTWILAIARNLSVDHARRQNARPKIASGEEADAVERLAAGSGGGLDRVIDADALRSWLTPLKGRDREVLALRYGADLPAAEIGVLLGLTSANVHQILSRSLGKLRAEAERRAELSGSA